MSSAFPGDHWENRHNGHPEQAFMPDVPFTPIWGQDAPPQMVAYPELMAGFPCGELSMWPRSQIATANASHSSHHNPTVGHHGRSTRSSSSSAAKKARRRVASIAQRRAANIRERRRMFNLNEAFDKLRRKVPTFAYEKRLSRIETLRLAITYIGFMSEILATGQPNHGNHLSVVDNPRSTDIFTPVAHHASASVATASAAVASVSVVPQTGHTHTTYNHSV